MTPSACRPPWCWIVLALIVVGSVGLIQCGLWLHRPMFHNQFVMRDGLPFGYWWPEGVHCDRRGNVVRADDHRNLLAVFLTEHSALDPVQFAFPRQVPGGVVFPYYQEASDPVPFVVPGCKDRLFVFKPDGERFELPLARGEANRIDEFVTPPLMSPDLLEPLERAYAEKHSAESVASLKQVIQSARREERRGRQKAP